MIVVYIYRTLLRNLTQEGTFVQDYIELSKKIGVLCCTGGLGTDFFNSLVVGGLTQD